MPGKIFHNPLDCPVTRTVQFIGGRWKPIILFTLMGGPVRFGKLTVFIPTVSKKMLTEQLRELENDMLISRKVFGETPPRVEYSLTEKGRTLIPIMESMCQWGKTTGKRLESKLSSVN